jgi:hypothetical protein
VQLTASVAVSPRELLADAVDIAFEVCEHGDRFEAAAKAHKLRLAVLCADATDELTIHVAQGVDALHQQLT